MSDIHAYAQVVFQAVYVFCICYAVISDFTKLTIPNWIPITLVAAFALFALLNLDASNVLQHLIVAAIIFCVGVGFFVAGWIGGGDVKLLTAVTLWMGLEAAFSFVIPMAALGAGLAFLLFTVNRYADELQPRASGNWLIRRLLELAQSGRCPYGVAIGIAALVPNAAPIWQMPAGL